MKNKDFNPFNRVQVDTPNTNKFDLSFDNKLTLDMGKLYPVLVQDTLPGDYYNITPEMLIRFAPMTFPIMHKIDATIHFFYVPNRILWKNFTKFLGNEKILGEPYAPPYIQGVGAETLPVEVGSLLDYLGLPLSTDIKEKVDAFPLLAYYKIINEYYQDQNNDPTFTGIRDILVKVYETPQGRMEPWQGAGVPYEFEIHRRAWQHDYFTSVLPWAQKGDAVNIPLQLGELTGTANVTTAKELLDVDPVIGSPLYSTTLGQLAIGSDAVRLEGQVIIPDAGGQLEGTINQLRAAMQLQKFLEKNARSGTRYNELIMAHFGENIGDARINRPEYIGGIKNNVVISEVLQTSSTDGTSALGDYAGYGNAVVRGNNLSFKCPEHGYIIGILSVIPTTAYMQGIPRKFSRTSFLDYYWSEFANIGEQSVLNKELYYDNALTDNNETFGYIPRYSEYKYNPSEAHGDFRTTMKDFTLVRDFSTRPTLGSDFIYVDPVQQKRIFAVTDPDVNSLYAHIYFDIKASRKIPFFTNPGGI